MLINSTGYKRNAALQCMELCIQCPYHPEQKYLEDTFDECYVFSFFFIVECERGSSLNNNINFNTSPPVGNFDPIFFVVN